MKLGGDIKSPTWLLIKGLLFLVSGILAGALLLVERFTVQNLVLLGIVVWSFSRLYYFMFYVVTHYIDDQFRFSGIFSFLQWLWRRKRGSKA